MQEHGQGGRRLHRGVTFGLVCVVAVASVHAAAGGRAHAAFDGQRVAGPPRLRVALAWTGWEQRAGAFATSRADVYAALRRPFVTSAARSVASSIAGPDVRVRC